LHRVEGLEWIRLHYAYPGHFTDELIEAIARLPKVCNYVDMPLQHSEDHILKAMQRPGRQKQIRALLDTIRSRIPDVSIRTSLIVGFPGESEEDFEKLVTFVQDMELDHIGVFTYSQEDGTPAALLEDQVPDEVKERRAAHLMEVARMVSAKRNARFVGRELLVLLEGRSEEDPDVWVGRTQYDAKEIDGQVFVSGLKDPREGDMVNVRITHSYDFDLVGEGL
jgi:ribosomal protein S12 methylthiotransferase